MPKAAVHPIAVSASPLHNLSTGDIADQLGRLKADAADLKAREDALKAELIRRGATEAEGALFRATLTEAARWTLDTDRVKAEMGEPWYSSHCRVGTSTTLRVSARKGLAVAA
jgi:hypothetical protein